MAGRPWRCCGRFSPICAGPAYWALVSWIRGPRRKRLSELREKFAAEAKRLIDDVGNVLYADWIIPVIAEVVKEAENRLEPSFTSTLHLTDPSVFSSSKDGEFKTSAFSQIAELLAESDGEVSVYAGRAEPASRPSFITSVNPRKASGRRR